MSIMVQVLADYQFSVRLPGSQEMTTILTLVKGQRYRCDSIASRADWIETINNQAGQVILEALDNPPQTQHE